MKKFLAFVLAATVFAACLKSNLPPSTTNCVPVSPSVEEPAIKAFTNADSVTYTKDTSGVYYHLSEVGTGSPAASTIYFTYKLRLLNGTLVDSSRNVDSALVEKLIPGFVNIRSTFKTNARILAVMPSALAYGCQNVVSNGVVIIPANSIIRFDLKITGTK